MGNANSRESYLEAGGAAAAAAAFAERTIQLDGIEGRVMLEFCKKFNCTLLIVEGAICSTESLWSI